MRKNQVVGYSKNMAIVMDEEDRLYAIVSDAPECYFPIGAAVDGELLAEVSGSRSPGRMGRHRNEETKRSDVKHPK